MAKEMQMIMEKSRLQYTHVRLHRSVSHMLPTIDVWMAVGPDHIHSVEPSQRRMPE